MLRHVKALNWRLFIRGIAPQIKPSATNGYLALCCRLLGVKIEMLSCADVFKESGADFLALTQVTVIRGYVSSSDCTVFLLHANLHDGAHKAPSEPLPFSERERLDYRYIKMYA